jgi:hypothetical protein
MIVMRRHCFMEYPSKHDTRSAIVATLRASLSVCLAKIGISGRTRRTGAGAGAGAARAS